MRSPYTLCKGLLLAAICSPLLVACGGSGGGGDANTPVATIDTAKNTGEAVAPYLGTWQSCEGDGRGGSFATTQTFTRVDASTVNVTTSLTAHALPNCAGDKTGPFSFDATHKIVGKLTLANGTVANLSDITATIAGQTSSGKDLLSVNNGLLLTGDTRGALDANGYPTTLLPADLGLSKIR